MADTGAQEEASIISKQSTEGEALQDVTTTTPQAMTSTETVETTTASSAISNVVVSESSKNNDDSEVIYTTTPLETQVTQDQGVVGIDNTLAQNTVTHVSHGAHGAEIVELPTSIEEPQQDSVSMNSAVTQNTVGDVVLQAHDKPETVEIVYSTTTTAESTDSVSMSSAVTQSTVGDVVLQEASQTEVIYTTTSSLVSHENQDVVGMSSAIAQNAVANVVINEGEKTDTGEVVFTVVAMENNIGELMRMHPGSLPKEVQLSLVQPPSSDNSNLATNSGQLSDMNQLALIAASIEESPKDSGNTQHQPPVRTPGPGPEEKQDSAAKSPKGRVVCTICDQDFSDLPSMRRHRLIHSEDKPYHCDFCDKSFRRKDNLREHRNIHTQENVYKCDRCGKTFPRKYTHKVHMSRFCGKAGHSVSDAETWAASPEKEGGMKPSMAPKSSEPCPMCFKTFRDASTLKRHLLTHSDERPYKCSQCDKAFRRKDHLQEHVIVHKLIRPFTCQTCGKSFSRKNGLKTHMIRTTHLLGFDDIVVPDHESKTSEAEVEVHVVEQVLAADQLVATSGEVFPETSQGDDAVQTVCPPRSEKDIDESNLEPGESSTSHSVPLEFSQVPTSSENSMEAETAVVFSEKGTKASDLAIPRNDETALTETSAEDIETEAMKAFLCPSCSATFPGKDELWEHFQEHIEHDTFACQHCFEVFANEELLENHQNSCDVEGDVSVITNEADSQGESQDSADQTATSEKDEATPNAKKRKRTSTSDRADQACTICNKVFRDATALKRHALVHSGERPHACGHCEKRFRRRDHLKAHEIAHHSGITSYECKTCDAVFNTRYALTLHVKTCKNRPSSPKQPVSEEVKIIGSPESKQCPICHKLFKDPSTQRRHFRIHSDERPFHCDVCSKSFRRKDNLKEHLLCHSEEKPFSCNHCGKSLSRRSSLTNHLNVCPTRKSVGVATAITSTAAENPIIPEIQFTEPTVQAMCISGDPQEISAAHLLATGLTSSVVTSDIASLDVTSSEMTSSELVPMEEDIEQGLRDEDDGSGNSFPCEECGKVFRAKWTLRFHQRIHTGEKPYTCKTCDRQFRQASHLKIHERTHSGERPYQCPICGRAFIDSSTLKRHERLHKDAADPNAVIDEQLDVTAEDDVIKEQEYVISNQVMNDPNEANVVQQAVEVSIADEGAIQLLVTTANSELANSAQPISTSVVTGMNQSETRLDESSLGHNLREFIRNEGVEKIETLEDWQQNHPDDNVGQLIYIETEQQGPSQPE
jgi:KRAB domain-containing zinc finger protein